MADVIVVYWRDIPAQVIVGKGRKAAKVQLPERFEQAIDRAAMKIGAEDTDSYLAEWRKAPAYEVEGEQADVAQSEANRIDAEYDQTKIKQVRFIDARLSLPVSSKPIPSWTDFEKLSTTLNCAPSGCAINILHEFVPKSNAA
mgnify:CR=1 FL=1